jgi:hypothetical protein
VTTSPIVTVVVVNWNGREITLECLASLRAVTYSPLRVLVVDNASTDGSVDAVRKTFPDVLVLPQERNLRFAGGTNAGIRRALADGADMVMLLNNDTIVDPKCVTALVARMHSEERCGMVAPRIYYADPPDLLWFTGGVISMWTGTMHHTGIRERDTERSATPRDIDYASGCCVLTSREVVNSVGMLDESYFMYSEDADWSMRIRQAGYRIVYEPGAKVWHKLSVSAGGHLSGFKVWNKFRSNFRFFARYAAWYHWLVFPWLSILMNAVSALRYLFTAGISRGNR